MKKPRAKHKPHWYEIHYSECVLCGSGANGERIRRYTPKPLKAEDRVKYSQDVCPDHFM